MPARRGPGREAARLVRRRRAASPATTRRSRAGTRPDAGGSVLDGVGREGLVGVRVLASEAVAEQGDLLLDRDDELLGALDVVLARGVVRQLRRVRATQRLIRGVEATPREHQAALAKVSGLHCQRVNPGSSPCICAALASRALWEWRISCLTRTIAAWSPPA